MVDITGHIAFGLFFSVFAWFVWERRASAAFVAFAVVASLLPDVDLWLQKLFPAEVHHHGVTHTVLFTVLVSIAGAAVLAVLFGKRIDEWIGGERFDRMSLFVFTTTAFVIGSLSHLLADMLSAPDIASPVQPFWPFFEKPWSVDVLYYDAGWINFGFIAVMIVVHLALAYATSPRNHRYRLASAE